MDTNQDKSIEENDTKEGEVEAEETSQPKESAEEQTVVEEGTQGSEADLLGEEDVGEAEKEEAAPETEREAEEAIPEEAEEKEKEEKREKEPEEEIVEERIYTIPLRRAWISPRKKRAPGAVRLIESFMQRHMKVEKEPKAGEEEEKGRLVISNEVNEKLWSRGIEKPPRNIRVRAVKDKEGIVTLYLAEGD